MTDSSGSHANFADIPPSALTASLLATDHDVAAQIARGHNLLRRHVDDQAGISRLVVELSEWGVHNREVLARRFVDPGVADTYASVAEPFVVPSEGTDLAAQVDLLQRQLRNQVEWLERLRLTIPDREQPDAVRDEPRGARRRGAQRSVAVLAATASSFAAAVVETVARATGILPVVVEDQPRDRRSLVRTAEETLPARATAVVVLERLNDDDSARPSTVSLLALGYAAGALGAPHVIAVCAPGVECPPELSDFTTVVMEPGDGWRQQLEGLLSEADLRTASIVSSIRRR
jgi:hypothetical protein